MRIRMAYHRDGLDVELPDRNVVAVLEYPGGTDSGDMADGATLVRQAIATPIGSPPLAELAVTAVARKDGTAKLCSAAIAVCDVTRPVPNAVVLPPILETLESAGIVRENITILVATGLHRPNEGAELVEMLGAEIVANYRIENHVATDTASHTDLGVSPRGVPIRIDSRWCAADVKIATGLIEPHFMAGWSGGRKLICPGLASKETICRWHSPDFLEHPAAAVGSLNGNPVHEENTWIARRAGCDFIVNVVLDRERRIRCAVAGDMEAAWQRGVVVAYQRLAATLAEPVDIVVTSAAGYPLDATYYQAIKGVVCAAELVKPGGTIICVAGMREGLGSAPFVQCFNDHPTIESFMDAILAGKYFQIDQWQIEELAKSLRRARCVFVTDGQPHDVLQRMYAETASTVESAIAAALERHGPDATIAVIPEGPYVLAVTQEPR